jgi:hypothetical protein
MKNTNRLGLAFCLGALLAYSVSACATLPVATPSERVARDATACLQSGPCVVLQVDNGVLYDAVVRVNGFQVGEIRGGQSAPLFVRESLLVDGRCAQVYLYFRDLRRASVSSRECIRAGGRFILALDPHYHAWLTPQGGGER